jgi:DNA-binding GntR family transcriptional regulator
MKTDTVFKKAFNDALDLVSKLSDRERLPSENALSSRLGVSRTTVRKVLSKLSERGLVAGTGAQRTIRLARAHAQMDRFPEAETIAMADQVESRFMEWMLRGNASPGTTINELDLARRFGTATTSIREFLNRFQRFGLIEKRPNAGWVFKGFTPGFALELFEIREMFELRSAKAFAALPPTSPLWKQLELLRREHVSLLAEIDRRYHDFSDLDSRFHRLINAASPNRFIDGFFDIITLIFHYHYQWKKIDERQRNEIAIQEHLTYIEALQGRSFSMVELAGRAHLASARETLIRSTTGYVRGSLSPNVPPSFRSMPQRSPKRSRGSRFQNRSSGLGSSS